MIHAGWWESFSSWFGNLGGSIEDAVLQLTTSAWIYAAIFGVTIVDGIFPPIPSESIVIAAATTWSVSGHPVLWAVWIAAAAGAWCGDQIAYSVGRTINVRRVPMFRGKRGHAALEWAERALEHRGAGFILAARFIPIGRVAVNLTAGALRYPRRRFMAVDAIGAMIWASYGCVLGVFAGKLVHDSLLLSIAIGVVGGIILGYLVDLVLSRLGLEPAHLPPVDELPEFHVRKGKKA